MIFVWFLAKPTNISGINFYPSLIQLSTCSSISFLFFLFFKNMIILEFLSSSSNALLINKRQSSALSTSCVYWAQNNDQGTQVSVYDILFLITWPILHTPPNSHWITAPLKIEMLTINRFHFVLAFFAPFANLKITCWHQPYLTKASHYSGWDQSLVLLQHKTKFVGNRKE